MEKSQKVLVAILAVVVVIVVVAAVFYITAPKITAEQIKEEMIEATGDVKTCQFDMFMTTDMTITNETGEVANMTMTYDGIGVVDSENKAMKMEMNMSMGIPEGPFGMEMEMYLINNTSYMKMSGIPGVPVMWMKQEIPELEEYWAAQNQVEQQREIMNASEVELLGEEKVDGIDCYILSITPDMEKYWETMMKGPGMSGMMDISNVSSDMFKEMSIKDWIAKDTYFPMKTEMQMKMVMVMTEENIPVPEAEEPFEITMDMDIDIDILFYDYNEPVSIELPEEAESAIETPMIPGAGTNQPIPAGPAA